VSYMRTWISTVRSLNKSAMTLPFEIVATVGENSQLVVPSQIAERYKIEPGQRLVIIDHGNDDEFVVRIIRSTYSGALTGVFGTTEQNIAYVRGERETWG
jgi:bifunctional DNA-binding transcriptional regulator/antitoxin component of YhaV-PrlF toxin-antitoxin module